MCLSDRELGLWHVHGELLYLAEHGSEGPGPEGTEAPPVEGSNDYRMVICGECNQMHFLDVTTGRAQAEDMANPQSPCPDPRLR